MLRATALRWHSARCVGRGAFVPPLHPPSLHQAISWGKIKIDARPVKVSCDATLVFPLIVSQTFAKEEDAEEEGAGSAAEGAAAAAEEEGAGKAAGSA